jgi:hypothetical protein
MSSFRCLLSVPFFGFPHGGELPRERSRSHIYSIRSGADVAGVNSKSANINREIEEEVKGREMAINQRESFGLQARTTGCASAN